MIEKRPLIDDLSLSDIRGRMSDLLREQAEILDEMEEIKASLWEAEQARQSGEWVDYRWRSRAASAKKHRAKRIHHINTELRQLSEAKKDRMYEQRTREIDSYNAAFVQRAKEVLPAETYSEIWRFVMHLYPGKD